MAKYVCTKLVLNVCHQWQEQDPSVLEKLAITKIQAGEIALAISLLLIIAYCGGLIGRQILKS